MLKIKTLQEFVERENYTIGGFNGTGKTRLASTFPKPVVIIDINENGLGSITETDGIYFVEISEVKELIQLRNAIRDDKLKDVIGIEPKTIVFDTWTQYSILYQTYFKKKGQDIGWDQWQAITDLARSMFRLLKDSDKYIGLHLFQEKDITDKDGNFLGKDLNITPALQNVFRSESTAVFRTYITDKGVHALDLQAKNGSYVKIRTKKDVVKNIANPTYDKIKENL